MRNKNKSISLQEFIDRGIRGWNAIYNRNNNTTNKYGIVALTEEKKLRKVIPKRNTVFGINSKTCLINKFRKPINQPLQKSI